MAVCPKEFMHFEIYSIAGSLSHSFHSIKRINEEMPQLHRLDTVQNLCSGIFFSNILAGFSFSIFNPTVFLMTILAVILRRKNQYSNSQFCF